MTLLFLSEFATMHAFAHIDDDDAAAAQKAVGEEGEDEVFPNIFVQKGVQKKKSEACRGW